MTTRTKVLLASAAILAVIAACFNLGQPSVSGVQTQSKLVAHYGNPIAVTNDIKLPSGILETFRFNQTTIQAHVLNGNCYYITYQQTTNWAKDIFAVLAHNGETWNVLVSADSVKSSPFELYPTAVTNKSNQLLYRSIEGNGASYNLTNYTLEVFSRALLEAHP